jgi:glycoside/pentoside/hexuronide:cation symporter, GPH family
MSDIASQSQGMRYGAARLTSKLYYGVGATPFGIKDAGFNYFILIYYNQVLGLDAVLAGLALAIAVVLDAISDVAAGHFSDKCSSKLGRRHPFMYAAALPTVVSLYFLWNPPQFADQSQVALFSYLVVMAIFVRSCLTFYEIPNASMGPELTKHYDDRTNLMAYRYVFGWLGGLGMSVLAYTVFFPKDPDAQLGKSGYELFGLVGSAAMLVTMLMSAIGTHRHIPEFHKPEGKSSQKVRELIASVYVMFRNRSFLAVFLSALFFGAAAGLSQAMTIYTSTFFWMLSSQEIGLVPLLGLVAVPLSFLLAPRLAERWGKKAATMRCFLFAILFLPTGFVAELLGFFPERSSQIYLPMLMLYFLVETTAIISMQIVFASMNADVVEELSAKSSGQRSEGLVFAARNFAKKAVSGVGVLLVGVILWAADFPEKAVPGEVAENSLITLILIYLPTIVGLYLISWWVLRGYDIDKAKHHANLQDQIN